MNIYQNIYCILLLCLSFIGQVQAQPRSYQPLKEDESFRKSILQKMDQRYQADVLTVKGTHRKEIKKEYTKRFERLSQKMEGGHFITNSELNKYFNGILDHIIAVNPALQNKDIRLLISRYSWPNASCHGEGTLVLNLGLVSRLENESQLAFVLCHELSHDYFDHVNHAIQDHVEKIHGKATQKKLKKIAKKEYNTYEEASALLQTLTFDMRRHGRFHEEEADSLALVWMKPTKYDTKAAIRCLEIFDEVDVPKRPEMIDFKKHFETADFKVRDRWLEVDEGSAFSREIEEESSEIMDSLKTHPDCQKRIQAVKGYSHNEVPPVNSNEFSNYIRFADYEIIEGEYLFGNYGQALYHAFLLVEDFPEDGYLHTMIMKCLYELHQYQKAHELGKVLDLPDERFEKNYNQYLSFIHNLRLRDLGKLGFYYGQKNGRLFVEDEAFRVAHLYCASLVQKGADWRAAKRLYFQDFPKGRFSKEVRNFKPDFQK